MSTRSRSWASWPARVVIVPPCQIRTDAHSPEPPVLASWTVSVRQGGSQGEVPVARAAIPPMCLAEVMLLFGRGANKVMILGQQAARIGVDRVTLGRLSGRGALTRLRHGVYSLPSATFEPLQDSGKLAVISSICQ
ncbi:type IV toxin-antitoxin system AbiEi family antitoxin domain-containing protein [Brevibacterium sandarakinum]|uniref:type IV toxin-antitoxin system AbiEi family antitoxin domain-containing protein n=1 Tax=Brevibacterium sandarakinum TaxID=629680 RepID=UPI0038B320FD